MYLVQHFGESSDTRTPGQWSSIMASDLYRSCDSSSSNQNVRCNFPVQWPLYSWKCTRNTRNRCFQGYHNPQSSVQDARKLRWKERLYSGCFVVWNWHLFRSLQIRKKSKLSNDCLLCQIFWKFATEQF